MPEQANTIARLNPEDDARALIPDFAHLSRIEIHFPRFRDGRGFSSARILREAGWTGPIVATGDVHPDQIGFMVRAGFSDFAPEVPLDEALVARTLARFAHVYQRAADARAPAWEERQG